MRKSKKIMTTLICLTLIVGLVATNAFAATANIGSTTHNFTTGEPYHFRLQADVTYSELSGNNMTVDGMQYRLWNYSDSADSIGGANFTVQSGSGTHTTVGDLHYNSYIAAPGLSNYFVNVNWDSYLEENYGSYYASHGTQYEIPMNTSETNKVMNIIIGVYGGDYYDGGMGFNYSSYWYGNGYVNIMDNVANTPYWTSKYVSTINNSNTLYSIYEVEENEGLLNSAEDELSFKLKVDGYDSVQFTTAPVIATDEEFKNTLDVDIDELLIENGDTMNVSVPYEDSDGDNTIFIKMPDITVVDDDAEMLVDDVDGIQIEEIIDEEDNSKILKLTYDENTFEIMPKAATLISGDYDIESTMSAVYFDETNETIGGTFMFDVPNDFTLENVDYELLLTGELINIEGEVYELTI